MITIFLISKRVIVIIIAIIINHIIKKCVIVDDRCSALCLFR